jgi:cold shock CspA family protein
VSRGDQYGTVTEFDAARGWGAVTGDDGRRAEFHCTQIADGSRAIAVGTAVRYRLEPGHLGRWEASAITSA